MNSSVLIINGPSIGDGKGKMKYEKRKIKKIRYKRNQSKQNLVMISYVIRTYKLHQEIWKVVMTPDFSDDVIKISIFEELCLTSGINRVAT